MRVVDSSVWIEWLINTPLGERASVQFPTRTDWVVPTIIQFEVFKWLSREVSSGDAGSFLAFTQLCRVVPLDTNIATRAARISLDLRLATSDSIIYATALAADADLLTCDAHFEGLDGVIYIPKTQ